MLHQYHALGVCRHWLLLFASLWLASPAQAQDLNISGRVTDETQQPLPGVQIAIKNSGQGTVTDASGFYSLRTDDPDAVLVFSFIGFLTEEIPVGNRAVIDLMMVEDIQRLDEVVVVGYGTQRKRDLTGSIGTVQGPELAKQPVQTPTQALQGRVAGVQVIASGEPNSQPQVRVRGTGSMLAGVNPLYVVDGVLTDDIRNLNNADIVSLEVLKDASSAAIYGVRGANGVIIITTRKGEAGDIKVNYDANAGYQIANRVVPMANAEQYTSFIRDTRDPDYQPPDFSEQGFGGNTNWFEEILRPAFQTIHNLSISGGSERSTFFVSGGYFEEEGIIVNNKFRRLTLRANNEFYISPRWTFSSQLSFANGRTQAVNAGGAFNNAYRAAPVVPGKIGDRYGNTSAVSNVGNPLLNTEDNDNRFGDNRLQGNLGLEYRPVTFLRFRTALNTELLNNNVRRYDYQYFNDETTFLQAGGNQQRFNSRLFRQETRSVRFIWDNTVTYEQEFGQSRLTVLGGAVTEQFRFDNLEGSRINVPINPDQWFLRLGDPDQQIGLNSTGDLFTRQSFFGRVNYAFANRYLLTASYRADGSSRFSEKWGYFPTVGLGWVLSEENFLRGLNLFSFLKLRASYGLLGNDNIQTGQFIVTGVPNVPYFFDGRVNLGTAIQDIKDQNLRWETTEEFNVGFEFGFFDGKLSGEADFYNKAVSDALIRVSIPAILGDPDNAFITNAASFRNRGVEFALNWNDNVGQNFTYRIGGNITFNDNQITGLSEGQALLAGGVGQQGFTTRSDNGVPVGSFFVLNQTGVFQTQEEIDATPVFGNRDNVRPGDFIYEDVNGDGVINDEDRIFAGSYQPRVYFGLVSSFTYRNFDLSADFYGNLGNKIYNGKKAFRFELTDNIEADFADNRWREDQPSASEPREIRPNTPASTYFIESGDFFRLNNFTFGYTFPRGLLERLGMDTFRLYFTSQNMFILQAFSGFSPELGGESNPLAAGIELGAYPTTRTFSLGLNISL